MIQNLRERNNTCININIIRIILVIEMRCKINNSTRFNMINRLYTEHKYNHYSHPVHLHTHTHIPYRQQTASEPFVELCFEADK